MTLKDWRVEGTNQLHISGFQSDELEGRIPELQVTREALEKTLYRPRLKGLSPAAWICHCPQLRITQPRTSLLAKLRILSNYLYAEYNFKLKGSINKLINPVEYTNSSQSNNVGASGRGASHAKCNEWEKRKRICEPTERGRRMGMGGDWRWGLDATLRKRRRCQFNASGNELIVCLNRTRRSIQFNLNRFLTGFKVTKGV